MRKQQLLVSVLAALITGGTFFSTGGLAFSQTRPTPAKPPSVKPAPDAGATSSDAPNNLAWNTLNEGLIDGDAEHCKQALEAFSTMGDTPNAVQQVATTLREDKDMLVRQAAASTLGEMGSSEAIPFLIHAINDSPEVSFTAAKSLWELGDKEDAREIFVEVMEGDRKDAPGRFQGAVREARKKLRPGELALMGAKEAAGVFGPGSFGVTAVAEAVKASRKDSGAPGRTIATALLAKDSDPSSLALLEWAIGDESPAVRVAVAKALGECGNVNTIVKLLPILSDDRHAVRYMAAASIVKLNQKNH
ncbi:MAG TPA: HEAT repeat domain-containing protein [Bryobacteraceae bacterium]|jgi:HEAT repeat protein